MSKVPGRKLSKETRARGTPMKFNVHTPTPFLHTLLRNCMNCGKDGSHFVPPSFGDEGFFMCKKKVN